jgi:hypothetical protein
LGGDGLRPKESTLRPNPLQLTRHNTSTYPVNGSLRRYQIRKKLGTAAVEPVKLLPIAQRGAADET